MDFSKMTPEQIENLIKIFHKLLNGKHGELNEQTKKTVTKELRDAKLEFILNR